MARRRNSFSRLFHAIIIQKRLNFAPILPQNRLLNVCQIWRIKYPAPWAYAHLLIAPENFPAEVINKQACHEIKTCIFCGHFPTLLCKIKTRSARHAHTVHALRRVRELTKCAHFFTTCAAFAFRQHSAGTLSIPTKQSQ